MADGQKAAPPATKGAPSHHLRVVLYARSLRLREVLEAAASGDPLIWPPRGRGIDDEREGDGR